MAKPLNEIADDLDAAQRALDVAGQAVSGNPAGRGQLYKESGEPIDLRQLANDLRAHASAGK